MQGNDVKSHDADELMRALLTLKNTEECYMFMEDICTISELTAIGQRLKIAGMLRRGMTCHEISGETGISTATISRVNRCLRYGSGGYDMVLTRLAE